MTQNVLGMEREAAEKKIRKRISLCAFTVVLAVTVNIILTAMRTPENHTAFLILNIAVDLPAAWFIVWSFDGVIIPIRRLIKISARKGERLSGTVETVSEDTVRYSGFDCREVAISGKKVFLIENAGVALTQGQNVTVDTVDGIVKGAVV